MKVKWEMGEEGQWLSEIGEITQEDELCFYYFAKDYSFSGECKSLHGAKRAAKLAATKAAGKEKNE